MDWIPFVEERRTRYAETHGELDERGLVRKGNYFLTPGPLDFLAHHGPSFVTEAIPWLQERLESAERRI